MIGGTMVQVARGKSLQAPMMTTMTRSLGADNSEQRGSLNASFSFI